MKRMLCCVGIVIASAEITSAMDPEKQGSVATSLQQREVEDMATARHAAAKTWSLYKDSVFLEDGQKFDEFLNIIFMGKYRNDACLNAPLLEYRMLLAKLYADSAKTLFDSSVDDKEKRSDLAQKVFLVCFAARTTMPLLFDSKEAGQSLRKVFSSMLMESYDQSLDTTQPIIALKQKIEKQGSSVDYRIARQMSGAYSYAKSHCLLLVNYIWRFFYENKVVKNCRPIH